MTDALLILPNCKLAPIPMEQRSSHFLKQTSIISTIGNPHYADKAHTCCASAWFQIRSSIISTLLVLPNWKVVPIRMKQRSSQSLFHSDQSTCQFWLQEHANYWPAHIATKVMPASVIWHLLLNNDKDEKGHLSFFMAEEGWQTCCAAGGRHTCCASPRFQITTSMISTLLVWPKL